MARLVEIVKNSPLVNRKAAGGYSVLDTKNKDPFVKGITFKLQYYASAEVSDQHSTPKVQQTIKEVCEKTKKTNKSLRKVILTVKAHCLTVMDAATGTCESFPIFRVAYCGGHGEIMDSFYFIHKTPIDKSLIVEVFKCSSMEKVKAITLTVAKAFNISFKAWTMEKKKKQRKNGNESPALQRKALAQPGKGVLGKMAPGVVSGGVYTPPTPRKPVEEGTAMRSRSGSFGDKPPLPPTGKNPVVIRAMAHNEITGSTHNVTLTDDFDKEFQELAESRSQPDLLRTSFVEDTDHFNLESIMDHVDADPEP